MWTSLGKLHGRLTDAAAALSALCIGVVALAYAGEVIARYFFRAPLNWSGDVGSYLLCACVFLGLPKLTREGAHVAVSFVRDRLRGVTLRRYDTLLRYLSGIVLIVVAMFVAQEGWRQFDQNILTSQATQISKWWHIVAIVMSAMLGAISGASTAAVAMLGRFVYPTMLARGCDRKLSIGTILAGASLDPIIPPSIAAVILATLAGLSVGDFLTAGILPGLLLGCAYASYAVIRTILNPSLDARTASSDEGGQGWRSFAAAAMQILPFLVVIFLVLGLIMLGIAQPTEAAAVGIVCAALLSVLYGKFSFRMLYDACYGAAITTTTVLVIIASAKLFSQLLAFTGATTSLIELVSGLELNRWLVLAAMWLSIWVICMFIDELGVMLIAVPVFTPVIGHLGFDPLWFWMMMLINFTLGGITPPIGYTNFVFKSVAPPDTTMSEIMRAAWPIVFIAIGCMVFMCFFPGIVTWLPAVLRATP